jgi:hypothetical protein
MIVAVRNYYLLVSGWGRPDAIVELNWTFCAISPVTGIMAAWVQIFYAWRIYMLSKWKVLPLLIIAIALMQMSATIAIGVGIPLLQEVTQLHVYYKRTIVWLGGAAAADVIIAITMLYFLFSVRRHGFSDTQRVINRLIRGTVETGVVTAACALTELILFQVSPKTNLHIFFSAMLAKIYYNALMTSLNSRRSASKEQWGDFESRPVGQTSLTFMNSGSDGRKTGPGSKGALSSFTTTQGTTGGRGETVVHISTATERDLEAVDSHSVEEELKAGDFTGIPPSPLHRQEAIPMARIPEGYGRGY